MMRVEDWPEQLLAAIERHDVPFAWGQSDCWRLPADCIEAVTGIEPLPVLRGYSTARGAQRKLRRMGWRTVEDIFAELLPEIPVAMAGRGDIGVLETDSGPTGVVFIGAGVTGKSEGGLLRLPRSLVRRAFKV